MAGVVVSSSMANDSLVCVLSGRREGQEVASGERFGGWLMLRVPTVRTHATLQVLTRPCTPLTRKAVLGRAERLPLFAPAERYFRAFSRCSAPACTGTVRPSTRGLAGRSFMAEPNSPQGGLIGSRGAGLQK